MSGKILLGGGFFFGALSGLVLGFMFGLAYHSDPRCFEDEVVISWHVGYTCEPLDDLPVGLQARIEARQ